MRYLVCMSAAVVLVLGSVAWGIVWDVADYDFGTGKDKFVDFAQGTANGDITEIQDADSSTVDHNSGTFWYKVAPAQIPVPSFTWEFSAAAPVGSNFAFQTRPGLSGGPTSKDVMVTVNPATSTYLLNDGATGVAGSTDFFPNLPAGWDPAALNTGESGNSVTRWPDAAAAASTVTHVALRH